MPAPESAPPVRHRLTRHLPLLLVGLGALAGYVLLRDRISLDNLAQHRAQLLLWRDQNLALAALVFVLAYVVIVALSLPGAAVASVTGGFLFGLAMGTALNVLAATIGATLIFLAVRIGPGRGIADRIDAAQGLAGKIGAALRTHEISVLFLLRLVPVVPFFAANVLPALVHVRLRNYMLTTVIGIIPGALVFTSIGTGLGEVLARGDAPDLSLIRDPRVIGPLAGLCLLAALPILLRPLRRRRGLG